MRQCPQCGQTFDDALAFCQIDGAPLRPLTPPPMPPTGGYAPPAGPPPGAYGAPGGYAPGPQAYGPQAYGASPPSPPRSGISATQALLGAAMLLLAGGGAAYFFLRGDAAPAAVAPMTTADTMEAFTAAPSGQSASAASSASSAPIGTRYADSPRDGFVALRSTPSTTSGTRLLQIPHGEAVEVMHENGPTGRVSGRDGRWIQVRYNGTLGWAFSGFLASPSGLADGQVPINQYGVINQPIAGYLNLRAGPTVRHAIVSRMYTGERVFVVACNQRVERGTSGRMGRWCRLTHGGVDGWAFDAFIDGIGPDG